MTIEEIEIIVTAKVEEALREFNKMKPQLMKVMEEVSKEISKVDFKQLNNTVKEGTNEVKKQLKSTFNPETLDPGFLKATEKLYAESIKKTQKYVKDVQNEMSKGDMQEIGRQVAQATEQVNQALNSESVQKVVKDSVKAIEQIKDKLEEVKETNKENEIKLDVSNEEALEQITQLEKEIDSLQKKITSREMKLSVTTDAIDKIRYGKQDEIRKQNPSLRDMQVSNRADFQLSSDTGYTSLVNQADKLNTEVTKYNSLLESAKSKLSGLKQNTSQVATEQEKTNTKTSKLQTIFNSVGAGIKSMLSGLGKMFQTGGKVVNIFKKFTPHLGNGMKSLLKYAATLFSLKSVYNTLNSAGQAWLSSQDSGAKQLSANIDYMKYALGSAVAPVIQYVTNLFYQLLKAVQSVIYALFKVNIFAKAGASAYNSMANNASKASKANKSLASIHSEINNVSSSSGDSGNNALVPSMDFSSLDTQLTPLKKRLADFFRPLVESWNTYSPQLISKVQETFSQIGSLLESIGQSFINIFANGTVYTILENILSIIGNIAEAFANAWNYNGNGDIIVQNLATALNNLLIAINNVVQSSGFQEWLNNCSDKFREITEKIAEIDWQPLIDALSKIGASIGTLALDILSGLVDVFKWFIENPDISGIILSIAAALLLVGSAINAFSGIAAVISSLSNLASVIGTTISTIMSVIGGISLIIVGIVTAISSFVSMLSEGFSWLKEVIMLVGIAIAAVGAIILGAPALVAGVIAAVVAVVATLVVAVKEHWNEIKEFISNGVEKVKEIFNTVIEWVKENWQGLLLLIVNPFVGAFKLLYDNCEGFRNFIDSFVEKIKNFFKDLWNNIQNILSNIGSFFSNIFNSIGNVVSNVFNGMWNTIRNVINAILGGIESMANGIVWGVNKVIDVLNNLNVHIPDWIPVFGGKDIGFHINQMSTVSLPRLAKGNVAWKETVGIFGEYSGAQNDPEITSPRSIMYETFVKALKENNSNNDTPISFNLTAIFGNKRIGQIAIEDIKDIKRATGEDLEIIFS
ncbi:MAG: hypothetical protein ACI4ON_00480 [Clostridia bacterium]